MENKMMMVINVLANVPSEMKVLIFAHKKIESYLMFGCE